LDINRWHAQDMFDVSCRTCDRSFLVGPSSLVSLHHTSDGLVGYARCPERHVNMIGFHTRIDPVDGGAHRVDAA
jgi:hypothetical protein